MRALVLVALLFAAVFVRAQPIECAAGELEQKNAEISYKSEKLNLVRISAARAKQLLPATRRFRFGDYTIHAAGIVRNAAEPWQERVLVLLVEEGGRWWQVQSREPIEIGTDLRINNKRELIVTRAREGNEALFRVTYTGRWHGANRAGETTTTLILDFRSTPRIAVTIECSDVGGGGSCTAPDNMRRPVHQLWCEKNLRCSSRQSMYLDWTTRAASRRFDLLTNRRLPAERFDAVTYASGDAFARAFATDRDAVRQRVLIDRVGIAQPIFEVSKDKILFAAHAREGMVMVRFFLLTPSHWREIPMSRLSDDGYPDKDERIEWVGELSRDYVPDYPPLIFDAYPIIMRGKRKLVEVIAHEGTATAMFWIMLDPSGRADALRVATDQPEWRHCGNVVFPPSATFLGLKDDRFPAWIEAIASWRMFDLQDGTLPKRCNMRGTIDWSPTRGWQVVMGQEPCTDPIVRPYASVITDFGGLSIRRVEPDDP